MALVLTSAKIWFSHILFSSETEFQFLVPFHPLVLLSVIDTIFSLKLLLLLVGFIPTFLLCLNLSVISSSRELGYPRSDEKYLSAFFCTTNFSLQFSEKSFFPLLAIHHLLLKWEVICICARGSSSFSTAAFRASRDTNFKRRDSLTEKHVAVVCTYYKNILKFQNLNALVSLWNFSFDVSPLMSAVQGEFEDLSADFIVKCLWAKTLEAHEDQDVVEGGMQPCSSTVVSQQFLKLGLECSLE